MQLDTDRLRGTFQTVIEREPLMTARFYEVLFSRYPAARPLFSRNSERAQQEMLQRALTAVIDHLEDLPWLASTLNALGAKHVEYGVTREMFDWVGDALLSTLAEILDKDWSEEVESAWRNAYGAICELMLSGMKGAPARA